MAKKRIYDDFRARGAASDLFQCYDKEVLIEGGAGTGKTRAVLEKANLIADKYPGCRILLCRKTRASMSESVLQIFEDHVLVPGHPLKSGATRHHRSHYDYPNGSRLVICGLDNPDRIMSTEFDMACLFEATEATVDDWEKVLSRLRNTKIPHPCAVCPGCIPRASISVRASVTATLLTSSTG
jgi:phage terminase large subunit